MADNEIYPGVYFPVPPMPDNCPDTELGHTRLRSWYYQWLYTDPILVHYVTSVHPDVPPLRQSLSQSIVDCHFQDPDYNERFDTYLHLLPFIIELTSLKNYPVKSSLLATSMSSTKDIPGRDGQVRGSGGIPSFPHLSNVGKQFQNGNVYNPHMMWPEMTRKDPYFANRWSHHPWKWQGGNGVAMISKAAHEYAQGMRIPYQEH